MSAVRHKKNKGSLYDVARLEDAACSLIPQRFVRSTEFLERLCRWDPERLPLQWMRCFFHTHPDGARIRSFIITRVHELSDAADMRVWACVSCRYASAARLKLSDMIGKLHHSQSLWLDATRLPVPGLKQGARSVPVRRWLDLSGRGRHAMATAATAAPTLCADGINGLPAVKFCGNDVLRGRFGRYNTVALVVRFTEVTGCMMVFAQDGADFSLRVGDGHRGFRRYRADGNDWEYGVPSRLMLNGDNKAHRWKGFPSAPVVIVAVKRRGRVDEGFTYSLSSQIFGDRGFRGYIGEVRAYSRAITVTEAKVLHEQLSQKWIQS